MSGIEFRTQSTRSLEQPAQPVTPGGLSVKQDAFIRSLLTQKDLTEAQVATSLAELNGGKVDKARASRWIERLLTLPKKPRDAAPTRPFREAAPTPDFDFIVDGRYALLDPADELNPVKFYQVRHGKPSRNGGKDWTGFIFVDRFSGDDKFPVKGHARIEVLKEIASNPLEAAQRYGDESTSCCVCGRNLTRALSRELGIGPVCGGRIHEDFGGMIKEARNALLDAGIDPDADAPEGFKPIRLMNAEEAKPLFIRDETAPGGWADAPEQLPLTEDLEDPFA